MRERRKGVRENRSIVGGNSLMVITTTTEATRLWWLIRVPRLGGRRRLIRGDKETKEGNRDSGSLSRRVSIRTRRRARRVWIGFDKSRSGYQIRTSIESRGREGGPMVIGSKRTLGVDGISICRVRLTARRVPLSRRASREGIKKKQVEYYGAFIVREGRVRAVFLVTDVRWFYVSFEAVLIPMYRRIGVWGSRERKIRAGYRFFRYTMGGSVRMLIAVLYRSQRYGTTDIVRLKRRRDGKSTGVEAETGRRRWRAFFRALAVKVPIVPVHVWLPEAHVEAPTGGSVRLAGIRLKRGTYGMVRRLRGLLAEESRYFTPFVYMRAVVGIIYPARTARRQADRKRIVAYASVSHMNLTLVGRFSITRQGLEGAIIQMVSHGRVAGGLFMGIGVRYDRYHTRRRMYRGGRAQVMPLYAVVIRLLTIANIGLPGTSAFVGEWRIFVGIVQTNVLVRRGSRSGIVLGAAYSRWRLNRLRYGNRKITYGAGRAPDRDRRERRMLLPVCVGTIVLGVNPQRVLDHVHVNSMERRTAIEQLK